MSLICFWHFFVAVSTWAATAEELENSGAPAMFLKKESFALPAGAQDPVIVYGNREIGFFEQRNPSVARGRIEISLVPPTYRSPITFELHYQNAKYQKLTKHLGERHYSAPRLQFYSSLPKVRGKFSFPFMLVNGVSGSKNKKPVLFPMILNSLGEVVWFAFGSGMNSQKAIMMQGLGGGRYLFMKRLSDTELKLMSYTGEIEREIDFNALKIPLNSHSFKFLPETNEVLYLSYECRVLPWYREFVPLFSGFTGWWRLFALPRRTYRGGRLMALNLDTLKHREIWNSYQDFSPDRYPSLFYGYDRAPDRFMDARTVFQYRAILRERSGLSDWGKQCDVDWTHTNSVDYLSGTGYLVSIRNLNLVVLIDLDGKLVWRMGEHPKSEVRFPHGHGFSMQHAASFLPGGDILIFNNNTPFRGYTGNRLHSGLMVVERPEKGTTAKVRWDLDLDAPQTAIRGSASLLANSNFFAYVPGSNGTKEVVLEASPSSTAPAPRMEFGGEYEIRGIEARPLYAIGTEEYLPEQRTNQISLPPTERRELSPHEIIDTTY